MNKKELKTPSGKPMRWVVSLPGLAVPVIAQGAYEAHQKASVHLRGATMNQCRIREVGPV